MMSAMLFLQQNPQWLLALTAVLGLIVGSFLTVVIHRTPAIMMSQWQQEIADFVAEDVRIDDDTKHKIKQIYQPNPNNQKLSLALPRSHCPHCQHSISWRYNLPIIGYLLAYGRCQACHARISLMYPAIELVTALLSVLVVHQFGVSLQAVFGLGFVWFLVALSGIDIKVQLLPDRLLVPLGILGLIANQYAIFTSLELAVWGLVVGFLLFWGVNAVFKMMMGKDGMGLGDAKLLGVLGAYLGVFYLPMVVFLSALFGVVLSILTRKNTPFAFGPYLAVGGIVGLIFGEQLWAWYLAVLMG